MSLKSRSDYFKKIAQYNKLIGHGSTRGGEVVNAFHRINNEEELNAACINWGHFPCLVHIGHSLRYKDEQVDSPTKTVSNELYILSQIDTNINRADAIELAYQQSELVMNQFLSFMREDYKAKGKWGIFFDFSLNNANAEQIGPINLTLYGWHLQFFDSNRAIETEYNSNDWNFDVNDNPL